MPLVRSTFLKFQALLGPGKRPKEEGEVVISFSKEKMGHVTSHHEDALVITAKIDGYDLKKVLID